MKTFICICLFLPLAAYAQKVKVSAYDETLKQHRIEMASLPVINTSTDKISLAFASAGPTIYMEFSGTGWGTSTIDLGNEIVFLFSNDSIVSIKSTGLQSFDLGTVENKYSHRYQTDMKGLEALAKYNLAGMRKYRFREYSDITITFQSAAIIKRMSIAFLNEIRKVNEIKNVNEVRKVNEIKNVNEVRKLNGVRTASVVRPLINIAQRDIRNHAGDSVAFCGKVLSTRYTEALENTPTELRLEPGGLNQPPVTLLIPAENHNNFAAPPGFIYDKKEVCVSGVVVLQNNVPQLIIRSTKQIRVTSPISDDEAALFAGDSVSINGKIASTIYLATSATKPTLLNMGGVFPDQKLTVVIENKNRGLFGEQPEIYFQDKNISVTGKVTIFRGKPQVAVSRKEQIKIVKDEGATRMRANATAARTNDRSVAITNNAKRNNNTDSKREANPATGTIEVQPAIRLEKVNMGTVYSETFASFPGGESELINFLSARLRCPAAAKTASRQSVMASYMIEMDGSISNIQIRESSGKIYSAEVVRVLSEMPKWKPRARNGYAVLDRLYQTFIFNCTAAK